MEWSRTPAPREIWSERLRRYMNSGLTVASFCRRERVSVPSFYYWRRKLRAIGSKSGDGSGGGRGREPRKQDFVPIAIRSSAAVKMRLPNGTQFWLPADNAVLLSAAIAAAGRLGISREEGGAC